MYHTEIPCATTAEVVVARNYLRARVEQNPLWKPAHTEEINALDHDTVVERTLRVWPHGWQDFLAYFGPEIRIAEQDEADQWFADAERAARCWVFASLLPAAALWRGRCSLTATEAVRTLGVDIAEQHRDGSSWRRIADGLEVPTHVAIAWAIQGRARQTLANVVRPFRAVSASE